MRLSGLCESSQLMPCVLLLFLGDIDTVSSCLVLYRVNTAQKPGNEDPTTSEKKGFP